LKNWKILVFSATVCAFFIQGFFVYSNYGYETPQVILSDSSQHGLQVWRDHNCQVCHQIHGFGGFLGPDLTNVIQRRSVDELHKVLIEGRAQMPAFGLSEADRNGVISFLTDLDKTGTGYPTLRFEEPNKLLGRKALALAQSQKSPHGKAIENGLETMNTYGCPSCHIPFKQHIGPDLTDALARRDGDYVRSNITNGRGQMPAFPMIAKDQLEEILTALTFINSNRTSLIENRRPKLAYLKELPWFEY
jgi:nitric oxide reductase subunit C